MMGVPHEEHLRTYLQYLAQAAGRGGLPPDGRNWDRPCPWFKKAAEELKRLEEHKK